MVQGVLGHSVITGEASQEDLSLIDKRNLNGLVASLSQNFSRGAL